MPLVPSVIVAPVSVVVPSKDSTALLFKPTAPLVKLSDPPLLLFTKSEPPPVRSMPPAVVVTFVSIPLLPLVVRFPVTFSVPLVKEPP